MKYSVIVPIYNEKESISPLCFWLKYVMDKIGQQYELIFVDDGSDDPSFEILKRISGHYGLKKIRLVSHCGKYEALRAGFEESKGEVVIMIDGDLRYDPCDIPKLLNKLLEGYDVVCGWRHQIRDNVFSKLISISNGMFGKIFLGRKMHDSGCALRAYKREVINGANISKRSCMSLDESMLKPGSKIGELKVSYYPRIFRRSEA